MERYAQRGAGTGYSHFDKDVDSSLWTSAAVLPEQFFTTSTQAQAGKPEILLMRAVLEDAVACFQHQFYMTGRHVQRNAREAEAWFFSDDTKWPFAFLNICTVLGLDPEYLRGGLRRRYTNHPASMQRRKRRVAGTRRVLKLAA